MFSNHNAMKLEISDRKKLEKFTKMWKFNNTQITKESKKKAQGKLGKKGSE